jgi:hypothetical protein
MKKSLLLLALTLSTLQAGTIVVGTRTTGNCYPFGCGPQDGVTHYLQQYHSSVFGGPVWINGLTFFADGAQTGPTDEATFRLYLSTSATAFGAMSGTLGANAGADEVLFGTFTFGPTMPMTLAVTGTPFQYDPAAGPLLMRIVIESVVNAPVDYTGFFQGDSSSSLSVRSYDGSFASNNQGFGLVTQIDYSTTHAPEPATLGMLAAGLAACLAGRRRLHKMS